MRSLALACAALIPLLWLAWAAYWWIGSRNVKQTQREESLLSRWGHLGPLVVAGGLLAVRHTGIDVLDTRLPGLPIVLALPLGALLTAAGLAFATWARRHIGRNWSATVTLKAGHELVTSGPYALVRHPIYTGLLLALSGSALAGDRWSGLLATLIALVSLWRKLRLEERWMRERFGAQYDAYARQVKALVPFIF
jgi:protein-S-isoprenylcysteine O-methyltransferase Ste14